MKVSSCRVLIWYWGRRGGGARYTLELSKELSKLSEVDLRLSLSKQNELLSSFKKENLEISIIDTYQNWKSFVFKSISLPFVGWQFWKDVSSDEIDVVICTMSHLWNCGVLFFKPKNVQYILVLHDAVPHEGENFLIRKLMLRYEISHASKVVTLSEHVKQQLVTLYNFSKTDISVIPHGEFNFSEFQKEPDDMRELLFFGRVMPYKGLEILLSVMRMFQYEGLDIKLRIVGSGNMGKYQKSFSDLKNVIIENRWVEEHEIPHIFSTASAVVLPYVEASQSGVIATAFACSTPAIITPVGGLTEQVKHRVNGIVSEDMSPESFYKSILTLLNDDSLLRKCSKGAKESANESLSWSRIALSFHKVLKAI